MSPLMEATPEIATEYLTVEQLSAYIKIEPGTIYNWKQLGLGPKRTKLGKRVLFKKSDVDAWIAGQNEADKADQEEK